MLAYLDDTLDGMVARYMATVREKLEAKGLTFSRAYGSSVCATSRAVHITAKAGHNNGIYENNEGRGHDEAIGRRRGGAAACCGGSGAK